MRTDVFPWLPGAVNCAWGAATPVSSPCKGIGSKHLPGQLQIDASWPPQLCSVVATFSPTSGGPGMGRPSRKGKSTPSASPRWNGRAKTGHRQGHAGVCAGGPYQGLTTLCDTIIYGMGLLVLYK